MLVSRNTRTSKLDTYGDVALHVTQPRTWRDRPYSSHQRRYASIHSPPDDAGPLYQPIGHPKRLVVAVVWELAFQRRLTVEGSAHQVSQRAKFRGIANFDRRHDFYETAPRQRLDPERGSDEDNPFGSNLR